MTIHTLKNYFVDPIVARNVFIIVAFMVLLSVSYQLVTYFKLPQTLAISKSLPAIPKETVQASTSLVDETPFFGEYVPTSLDQGVKKSILNVKIVGIIYSPIEADAKVLLDMGNGQEKIFRVGDTIGENATVKRITKEGVLILREGQIEGLTLPKNELRFEPVTTKPLHFDKD